MPSGKGARISTRKGAEVKTMFLMYGKNEHPVIRRARPEDDCELLIEVAEQLSGESASRSPPTWSF